MDHPGAESTPTRADCSFRPSFCSTPDTSDSTTSQAMTTEITGRLGLDCSDEDLREEQSLKEFIQGGCKCQLGPGKSPLLQVSYQGFD